ncbi:uncharacterized protein KD926_006166 [Aspergillus affinis]|uniref:uncharacterized protein n=1 Tax=Aspergillus affinis TaxID=1070780 RepID=UPI0022FECB47|nr:uncharacterized protein KD926_006166 [Aspergillus affinis]KAI9042042.1 hypothetical protein KD926_006166 [Aspergillus affinis]
MMSGVPEFPSIFITGITGYIGGDVWHAISEKYPSCAARASCLVRTKEKGVQVLSRYPSIRLVYGDLDNRELIEAEASKADIILHLASIEHVDSSRAISRALQTREKRHQPTYWIAISGTDNIAWEDCKNKTYGEPPSDQIYDDWEGLSAVASLPESAPHRDVEIIQLESGGDFAKTAIVSAPCIYGIGRGSINQRSIQIPDLARYTLQNGYGLQLGRGLSIWPNVHIEDLSDVFLRIFEEAIHNGSRASWNREGYYFAENGEHVWREVASLLSREAQKSGLIQSAEVRSFEADEADKHIDFASLFYGAMSRCRAIRARRLLEWEPRHAGIEEAVLEALEIEARRLEI